MNNKKLLEKKDWEYYIFKQNDILELLVTVEKPNPGLDIIPIIFKEQSILRLFFIY